MVGPYLGRRFFNSKGFSLAELMVGMGVSMTISLVASFAFMMAFDVYIRTIRQYETEMEMSALMYGVRSTMVTGSYLRYGGVASGANNALTNIPGAGGEAVGYGRLFSITDASPATTYAGELLLVAQFNRELSLGGASGRLQAVQIVYQRPNTGTNDSGAIYIDTELNPAPGGGWVRLSPVNAPQMYTRLTNFEVDNVKVIDAQGRSVNNAIPIGPNCLDAAGAAISCVNMPVLSADINMTMRYFVKGRDTTYQWCNKNRFAANAACNGAFASQYFDIERKMTVVFSNNALELGEYLPRRPFGNVYFFAPWLPTARSP
jgi:hypothetical protein